MPEYLEVPTGIKWMMSWSDFIIESCSGLTNTKKLTQENRENLPILGSLEVVDGRLLIVYHAGFSFHNYLIRICFFKGDFRR